MKKEEIGTLLYQGENIPYTRAYKKVKNLNLRVREDGSVYVSANRWVSNGQVEAFILKHADFILRTRNKIFAKKERENLPCQTGTPFYFLGKKYLLRVTEGVTDRVVRDGNFLELSVKKTDEDHKAKVLSRFRKEEGGKVFRALVEKYYPYFSSFTPFPEIVVKSVKSRWGSCTPLKHRVMFAEKLTEKPMEAIEYVVVHELSHFVHQNHSKAFYAVVASVLPNWKEYRKLLYI